MLTYLDTYTIDSEDGKEQVRKERARIDTAFGIVPADSKHDDNSRVPASTGNDQLPGDADIAAADDDEDVRAGKDSILLIVNFTKKLTID